MKAAVIYKAGGPELLKIEARPVPVPKSGQVLIAIKAFGLNRSELFTRSVIISDGHIITYLQSTHNSKQSALEEATLWQRFFELVTFINCILFQALSI